jgi:hypothetical protein
MKEILINGEKWFYKVTNYSRGEYGEYHYPQTSFFRKATVITKSKKWGFFGPIVFTEVENNEPDFTIRLDVTNPKHTREQVKEAIDEAIAILMRKEEIEQGIII